MNTRHAQLVLAVAREGSFTAAAKSLFIAQPTLSDAISSLEKELGVALFCRDRRSVKLTSNGSEFYRYVSDSLRSLDDGIDAMNRRKTQLGGTVSLGATFTVQDDYLPTLLKAYREHVGDEVRIETYQAFTNYLTQSLHNETLDVAFCGRRDREPDIEYFPVLNRSLELGVRADHPLAGRSSIALEELCGQRLITYRRGTPIGEAVQRILEQSPLEGVEALYDDDITMASALSVDGGLAALMLNSIGLKVFSNITTVPLEGVRPDFYWVYLAVNAKHAKTAAVQSFIDFVKGFDAEGAGIDPIAPRTAVLARDGLAVHALRDEPDLFDVGVQLEAALAAERAADAGILVAVGVSVLVAQREHDRRPLAWQHVLQLHSRERLEREPARFAAGFAHLPEHPERVRVEASHHVVGKFDRIGAVRSAGRREALEETAASGRIGRRCVGQLDGGPPPAAREPRALAAVDADERRRASVAAVEGQRLV